MLYMYRYKNSEIVLKKVINNSSANNNLKGELKEENEERTIMLVGATGSGKSTLVDGIVNYVTGVSFDDPFRFTLMHLEKEEQKNDNQVLCFKVYYQYVVIFFIFLLCQFPNICRKINVEYFLPHLRRRARYIVLPLPLCLSVRQSACLYTISVFLSFRNKISDPLF